MSENSSLPTPEEIAQVREQVAKRVKEEGTATAESAPVIDHEFVKRCLYAGQKGDGILYAALHKGGLLCAPELKGLWFEWTGSYWKQVVVYRAEAMVEAVVARYEETRLDTEVKISKAKEVSDTDEIRRLERLSKRLRKNMDDLREGRRGFGRASLRPLQRRSSPCADGGVRQRSLPARRIQWRGGSAHREFRPARPGDRIRRTCDVEWQGIDAPAPTWEPFVREIVGEDDDVAAFLQRVFGYAITGLSCEPLFVVLAGEGRNGKTVMVETLGKVLGDYMAPIPAELLLDQGQARDADKPTPTIMSLNGLRVAYATESDENRRFSIARVKWLSGDDRLTGRYMWDRDPSSFYPTHTLFLLTNPQAPCRGPRVRVLGSAAPGQFPRTATWTTPHGKTNASVIVPSPTGWKRSCPGSWPGWCGDASCGSATGSRRRNPCWPPPRSTSEKRTTCRILWRSAFS